ncbi:MAG: DUF1003 domain-containing protein [Gemmatimonadaceae bacterium]|jgi:uncharacterized membrane protein
MKTADDVAAALMGVSYAELDAQAQKVANHIAQRLSIARNTARESDAASTVGQRAADAVALFGGSWTFIGIFATILVVWVGLNSFYLVRHHDVFDAYPYILLNLFLSMLAAIQAPIILMSQNRQAEKDRRNAEHDYEVNLKAELEIMLLHEKMDQLRQGQWAELLTLQSEQLRLLATLTETAMSGERQPPT